MVECSTEGGRFFIANDLRTPGWTEGWSLGTARGSCRWDTPRDGVEECTFVEESIGAVVEYLFRSVILHFTRVRCRACRAKSIQVAGSARVRNAPESCAGYCGRPDMGSPGRRGLFFMLAGPAEIGCEASRWS